MMRHLGILCPTFSRGFSLLPMHSGQLVKYGLILMQVRMLLILISALTSGNMNFYMSL